MFTYCTLKSILVDRSQSHEESNKWYQGLWSILTFPWHSATGKHPIQISTYIYILVHIFVHAYIYKLIDFKGIFEDLMPTQPKNLAFLRDMSSLASICPCFVWLSQSPCFIQQKQRTYWSCLCARCITRRTCEGATETLMVGNIDEWMELSGWRSCWKTKIWLEAVGMVNIWKTLICGVVTHYQLGQTGFCLWNVQYCTCSVLSL